MYFLVYDIHSGKINIIGTDKNLKLDPHNEVIKVKREVDPTKKYVDISTRKVINRPTLKLKWNKTTIKNDGKDTASCDLGDGYDVVVYIPDMFRESFVSDGDKLEINSLVESDVIVTIDQFPYQQYMQIIEVTSNE